MKISCIAIDDEPLALEIMEDYISKLSYLEHKASFGNSMEALNYLKENRVDLLFLDIQMPDLTGIQLAQVLDHPPAIIFTTAYDNFAVKSYELDAVDYLLKPIEFERFIQATEKVYKMHVARCDEKNANQDTLLHDEKKPPPFLFVKTEHRMEKVFLNDILYVEGMKNYLRIVGCTQKIMTLLSFRKIEDMLPAGNFIRVHKSFIVAIDKIESIERNRIKIGEKRIPVGESYKQQFYKRLEDSTLL